MAKKVQRGASVIILNERGGILLGKRGKKSKNQNGRWENCGGRVEEGEDFEVAAVREVKEERGIDVEIVGELYRQDFYERDEDLDWFFIVYEGRIPEGQEPKIMEPDKCEELRWVKKSELKNLPLASYAENDFVKLGWL